MIRLIHNALAGVFVAMLLVSAAAAIGLRHSGGRLLSVQTSSMVPTFGPGNLVVIKKSGGQDIHPGEVISYHSPRDARIIISHRLIQVDRSRGLMVTKGDHLNQVDQPVPLENTVGRVIIVIPKLGHALDVVRRPLGLLIAAYIPGGALIVLQLRHLAKSYGHAHYLASGY